MELMSFDEFVALRESNSVEARELELYIINDGEIYRQRITPTIKNLQKKFKKGDYDKEKAVKAWMYAVEDGAKKYHKEFGSSGSWSALFPKSVRMEVASNLEGYYKDEVESVDDKMNEDVMGMVANGSMDMLFGSKAFKDLERKNFFFYVKEGKPLFGYNDGESTVHTDIEIPILKKKEDLSDMSDEELESLVSSLKKAIA